MGDAVRMKIINTGLGDQGSKVLGEHHGRIHVLMTDNAAYYTSAELAKWCDENRVDIVHCAIPASEHRDRRTYHRTLIDRIRNCDFINGGS